MKKFTTFIAALLTLIMYFALVSCGDAKTDGGKKDEGQKTVTLKTIENITDYKIVRGDTCSDTEKDEMVALRKALNEKLGITISATTDWVGKGQSESKYEILVGTTNRAQSAAAAEGLRYNDYAIKMIDDKIVIIGGSDDSLISAVDFFIANMLNADAKTIKVPSGDGYIFNANYKMDKLTVEGTDIKDFKLYFAGKAIKLDDFHRKLQMQTFGLAIDREANDDMQSGTHYIIIDDTGLSVSDYSITVGNGNITIKGSYSSVQYAMNYFADTYFDKFGTKEYDLKAADSVTGESEKKDLYTKEQLMKVLTQVYNNDNACIIGQQGNASPTTVSEVCQNFKNATGENPGIVGIDLACYGVKLPELNEEGWSQLICDIVDYCADGGILTASSHFANPSENWSNGDALVRGKLGFDNTKAGYEEAFEQVLTEGTEYNKKFKAELEIDGRFLKALGDNGVTVLWRPLHELNGSWFWFCTTQSGVTVDASYLKRMWVYIYSYFVDELGINNLIWVYSPNVSSNKNDTPGEVMSTMYCYPGDEYVDMVACDWYSSGNLEIKDGGDCYLQMTDTGKIGAIGEFGPTGPILITEDNQELQIKTYNSLDLLDDLLTLKEDGYRFTYLLTWTSHWSIPWMGKGDEFMAEDYTLGQKDVAALFKKLK